MNKKHFNKIVIIKTIIHKRNYIKTSQSNRKLNSQLLLNIYFIVEKNFYANWKSLSSYKLSRMKKFSIKIRHIFKKNKGMSDLIYLREIHESFSE